MKLLISLLMVMVGSNCACGAKLILAKNGKTKYVIVTSKKPSVEVKFAVTELQKFLKQSTGANFKTVTDTFASKHPNKIIVGACSTAVKLLGRVVVNSLKSQESLVITKGNNLFLLGGKNSGINYAIYSFLEQELGCRWYTVYNDIKVPKHRTLLILQLNRRTKPAFKYRNISNECYKNPDRFLFYIRNRLNMHLRAPAKYPAIKDITPQIGRSCHTMFFLMNPKKKYHPAFASYPKPARKNLFKTNPEFFSLDNNGKRTQNIQLCFSNKNMRKLLTQQIVDVVKASGGKGIVTLDANDRPGHFCYCSHCLALEKEYGCIGGPLFDYLIELCGFLKKNYPDVMVRTLAYRKKQSEIPPKNISKLPDNLVIVFAPIDDNFAVTLKDPSNVDTYNNLKKWCEITKNVWVWYYRQPCCREAPPFGDIEKQTDDVRNLFDAGVNGTQYDPGFTWMRYNFSDLKTWLLLKLFQNPNQPTQPLIKEFTNYYYGAAAKLMRGYIFELEKLRKEMKIFLRCNPSLATFRYLTPKNIVRWEKLSDKMEKLTAHNPQHLFHVKLVRITLDIAALCKYQQIKAKYPTFITAKALDARIRSYHAEMVSESMPKIKVWTRLLDRMLKVKLILATADLKPLPKQFKKIPNSRIRRGFPTYKITKEPNAASGYAQIRTYKKDYLPYKIGFYDNYNKKFVYSRGISQSEIIPDCYHIYKLGRIKLTQGCQIWGGSWRISFRLEQFYVLGFPDIEWDAYISLRFEGKGYSSKSKFKKNRVLADQVILVRVPKKK